MKKSYIAMAVLATAALVSCQREESFNETKKVGENDVVFSFKAGATKAAENAPTIRSGVVIPIQNEEAGVSLLLEETIVNLDELGLEPATKGTPAYTENVGVLYKNDLSVYGDNGSFKTPATYTNMDENMVDGGWRYNYNYGKNPWPTDGSAVGLYLNMPAAPNNVSITEREGGAFTFSYTSPVTARDQQDILFAYRTLSEEQHKTYLPNGAPVLFNHALTGVKFAIGNDLENENASITSITFNGLVNTGTCVITPVGARVDDTAKDYRDDIDNYTSAGTVAWTATATPNNNTISSGEYGNPVDFNANGSFSITTGEGEEQTTTDYGKYPASFSDAGNTKNLNDGAATQTFWLIPQVVSQNVTLTITYTYGEVSGTATINFGKALADKNNAASNDWKAGELRTFTLRVDDVNVKIDDEVTISEDQVATITDDKGIEHTIYGGTKDNVIITNTGNTAAFIRAAIIGQWVDSENVPVFSFTDFAEAGTEDFIKEIDSWYNDQFGTGTGHFGNFDGLVGYTKNNNTGAGNVGWVKGNDNYYYYTLVVEPGAATGSNLFNSYTVTLTNVPKIKVAGELQEVHFVMEIASQAISAKKLDGSTYKWNDAWNLALGYDPSTN